MTETNNETNITNQLNMMDDLFNKLIQVADRLTDVASQKKKSSLIIMDSCKELGDLVANRLHDRVNVLKTKQVRYGNNEICCYPEESVRKKDIFIIASGSNVNGSSINDNIMSLCAMIRSCRDGSSKYITVIFPYLPYCRSDKKDKGRMPIMSKFVCEMIKLAGANRLVNIDLHAGQIQGFFDGPLDNLYAIHPLIEQIKTDFDVNNLIIVSPDAGGEKRATAWADKLKVPCTFLTKHRDHNRISTISHHELVHNLDFEGKTVIFVDDMCDTAGTLKSAAEIVKKKGAKEIITVVTHGIFSGNAFGNLNDSCIDHVYVTNSLPQEENVKKSNKIKIVDISGLISDVMLRCINAESVSELFN
jgi:ribose-phosphate pyrophosphokinase